MSIHLNKRLGYSHERVLQCLYKGFEPYNYSAWIPFFELRYVFFSHQWLANDRPDPEGLHYRAMIDCLDQVLQTNGWNEKMVFVWVDYSSIPQQDRRLQLLAIEALPLYASTADVFVAVAPAVRHASGEMCGPASYATRVWCRAEQVSHYFRRGSEAMFLSADGALKPMDKSWLDENLSMFFLTFILTFG